FLQIGIFLNILEQSTFVGVIAVGLSLTLIAGEMDLSVESVMALAAMLVALTFGTGGAGGGLELDPAWLAFPVSLAMALGVGAAVGALNGLLVVRFEINAFIVTLASYIWGRGLVVALSGGRSVYGLPDALRGVAVQRLLGVPLLAWVLIAVYLVFSFLLAKTPFGRHLFMIGGNAVASNRAGIRVARNVILAFLLSGMLAGLAGWLLASRTAGATANLGIGMLFQAFAAVVIGGVSLRGGVGRLSGVFAGVLLLSSIQTAINVMGMPPHYTMMIQGLLVLTAVLLDTAKNNLRRSYF
ncbi:MAG: ABC transporter permease, partial [Rhodobacteraceae bacterium]|nr:ABC transporter permease [Paracoccaceae bacterium]